MKRALLIILLTVLHHGFSQTNLIDASTWSSGTGNAPNFYKFGPDAKNVRETGTDPFNNSSILWKCIPDGTTIQDGGWSSKYYTVDPSKSFRFTVWVKKTNSNDGNTLFGFHALTTSETASSRQLDGTALGSPYFFWGDLPQLDQWYLLVGYAYGHGHTDLNHQGGIYDTNGTKIASLTDFKLSTNTNWLVHRNYLYNDANTADRQYFFGPTLYEINGQEPAISEIINPNGTFGSGLWAENGSDIYFDIGKVGVGTNTVPADFSFAVNGKIITEEVKVQLSGDWPDYVFTNDHDLPTLQQVQDYIAKKGHLPNIPSAKKVKANGIELGEMNRLLLEKIEELTLYILQQEERIKTLEQTKN